MSKDFVPLLIEITKLVNFLRSKSALTHRNLKQFLKDLNSEFTDVLLYNNVRWLSKGQMLKRVWNLRGKIVLFLEVMAESEKRDHFLHILQDPHQLARLAFLVDILSYLNILNLSVQGKNKTMCDLSESVLSFKKKIEFFIQDSLCGNLDFFPTVTFDKERIKGEVTGYLNNLKSEFHSRFTKLEEKNIVFQFLQRPLTTYITPQLISEINDWFPIDEVSLKLEMCDFSVQLRVNELFKTSTDYKHFWIEVSKLKQFPVITDIAFKILTMFGSTWICESTFSAMSTIKCKNRNSLRDDTLENLLRISRTSYEPQYTEVMRNRTCHFSH